MTSSLKPVQLSSNWKKLQQELNSQNQDVEALRSAKSPKRKATGPPSTTTSSTSKGDLKRRKLTTTKVSQSFRPKQPPSSKPRLMGSYLSSFLPSHADSSTDAATRKQEHATPSPLKPSPSQSSLSTLKPGKYIALDCEMVGTTDITPFSVAAHTPRHAYTYTQPTTTSKPPEYSILARVSLVSYTHDTVYDSYVLPPPGVRVSDYRTPWSGITPAHLDPASRIHNPQHDALLDNITITTGDGSAGAPPLRDFATVQRDVAALLQGRVLVGHALRNDLAVLGLQHPARDVRDTARYSGYRALAAATATAAEGRGPSGVDGVGGEGNGRGKAKGRTPALRKLAREVLGWEIQGEAKGGHDSVEDARAAMELFRREKKGFEEEVVWVFGVDRRTTGRGRGGVKGNGGNDGDDGEGEGAEEGGLVAVKKRKPRKKKKKGRR